MESNIIRLEMPEKELRKFTDLQLSIAVRNSDETAFSVLYYRYYEPLYRYIWFRTYSKELSRDLIQDVFARIWIKRNTLNPKKSIKAFIYCIASNLIIDHYRKQSSKMKYNLEISSRNNYISNDTLDNRISLQTAVQKLHDRLKNVFILSRYEGMTYKEIADICKISVKTVEKRMSKALKILRIVLKES